MNATQHEYDDAPATVSKHGSETERAGDLAGLQGDTVIGRTATINRPRGELFAFWRDFSNLPQFMQEIDVVEPIDNGRSRWTIASSDGEPTVWDVIITDERPDDYIVWASTEGAVVKISGRVDFRDATGGRGTEVTLTTAYDATGGTIGKLVATLLQREPGLQARRNLRRFKQLMETGEVTVSSWTNAQAQAERD